MKFNGTMFTSNPFVPLLLTGTFRNLRYSAAATIMFINLLIIFSILFPISSGQENYKGESFPVKYLHAEDVVPESSDVEYYLEGLSRILGHIEEYANDTDINRALGTFYMTTILKRTIKENKNKMQKEQLMLMNEVLLQADNIMSHYFYGLREDYWDTNEKRVAELFKDEDLQIEAIGEFNRNRLQKWLATNTTINGFAQDMDELQLQRLDYLKYTDESIANENYSIALPASDFCLGVVIYNPRPIYTTQNFKPCVAEEFCSVVVYENTTSISYTLSHRMLNVMVPRHLRRCYMRSPAEDDQLMGVLCSSMYRETVYLARLGYFYRDMWIEHIALCGLLGYEEFFRRHWFQKLMSWIDDEGCIAENLNLEIHRSRFALLRTEDPEKREDIRRRLQDKLTDPCHWHPMAVGLVTLAHGVRHAVHFSQTDTALKDEL